MKLLVDEQVVNYENVGTGYYGKTIVMVHGWGDDMRTFDVLREKLSKKYSVIALDLPGFGGSSDLNRPWTLDDYADFLAAFIKKRKRNEVYCFIGHSNGGSILIRGLATGVLKSDRLILLASAGIRNKAQLKKGALKAATKSGKAVTSVLPKRLRVSIRKRYYGAIGSEMLLVPDMEETFKNIVGQDIQEDAAKLSLPTLIIYGDEDTVTPPADGELLHSLIKGSKFVSLMGAGHFVHRDSPKVETLIEEFL